MGLSALVYQKFTKPNPGNNNENYEDILKKLKDAQDKAKKDLLSGKTSDKVDLKNGKNTEEAIMKFAKESEDKRKKALEELFNNLAEQVTNVFKNNSNIISGTSQTEKPQIPDINTDSLVPTGDYSQIEKPQLSPDILAMGEQIKNAGNYNKPTNPTVPPLFDAGAKIKQLETQLASMQEAYEKLQAKGIEPKELKEQIDKAQAELDKLRDYVANPPQPQDIAQPVAGGTSQSENPQTPVINIATSLTEISETPVINAEDTSLLEKTQTSETNTADKLKQSITDLNNEFYAARSLIETKKLETQLANMQEAYEKLQAKGIEPKGLKEQIDKVQAELDKLRAKNN